MKKILHTLLISGALLSASADTSITQSIADSNNKFAFDLYKQVNNGDSNMMFSPYSITSVFSMAYNGADGETAKEIKETFYLPDDKCEIKLGNKLINQEFNNSDNYYTLNIANGLWSEKTLPLLPQFVEESKKYFDAKVTQLDFKNDPNGAKDTINNYIEEKTNGTIKNLIPELNSDTSTILTNAIYFKANWTYPFFQENTHKKPFTLNSGKKVDIDMMYQQHEFNYMENDQLQMASLSYGNGEINMNILLPKKGTTLAEVENLLTYEQYNKMKKKYRYNIKELKLSLPKFKFDTQLFMKSTLKSMGLNTPFSPQADFSKINGAKDITINELIHKSFISLDEEGTEASAATAMMITGAGMSDVEPPKPIVFNANHPFIFIIEESKTGNILFMGRINNPKN